MQRQPQTREYPSFLSTKKTPSKDILSNTGSLLSKNLDVLTRFWYSTTETYALLDADLNILAVNRAGLKMWKLKKENIIGKNIVDVAPYLRDSERLKKYREVIKTGKSYSTRGIPTAVRTNTYMDVLAFKVMGGLGLIISDVTQSRVNEAKLMKSRGLLRSLSLHLQTLREEESRRIAREIHDEMAPALTALKMDLSWVLAHLNGRKDPDPRVEKKIDTMTRLIDSTIESMQKICTELRPVLLDDLGLIPALEWQMQEFQRRTNIKCVFNSEYRDVELCQDHAVSLFRIFQEGLTNIARHASASRVGVSLRYRSSGKKLELRISDNGQGITHKQIDDPRSFGLIGMRERLHPYRGQLRITGRPGKGTVLTAILHLDDALG